MVFAELNHFKDKNSEYFNIIKKLIHCSKKYNKL